MNLNTFDPLSDLRFLESKTLKILLEKGYDLLAEYYESIISANLNMNEFVLDVGTGSGRMLGVLVNSGYNVISGDIDFENLLKTQKEMKNIGFSKASFINIDAEKMTFPDNFFSSIVSANVLHELKNPFAALREIKRICKYNGKIMIMDFNEFGFRILDPAYKESHGFEHKNNNLTFNEINHWLVQNFESVNYKKLSLNNVWITSKKITNNIPSHSKCFACGVNNAQGLNLIFKKTDNNRITADCLISDEYNGYPGKVQGGIIAAILDSAMANCLYLHEIEGVTARMNIRYHKPLLTNLPFKVTAVMVRSKMKTYELKSHIIQQNKNNASATGFFMSKEKNLT